MLLKSEMDLLKSVPIFSGIEPSRLKLIAYTAEAVAYRPGQAICVRGQMGDAAFVLMEGEADVSIPTSAGDYVVATLKRGDVVGEISILCDTPRTATVTARGSVTALRVRKDSFLQLLKQFPEISAQVMRGLAERLSRTNDELARARSAGPGAPGLQN